MITKEIKVPKKPISKKTIFKLVLSLLLVGLTAGWSIPYTLTMRGCFAIGGELYLMIGMGALPWLFQCVKSMVKESTCLWANEDN